MGEPLRPAWPYGALALLSLSVWPLAAFRHAFFFPGLGLGTVGVLGLCGAGAFGWLAFARMEKRRQRRRRALGWMEASLQGRQVPPDPSENDVVLAGRVISRLTRNADEDLREMDPDFSMASFRRLPGVLGLLLDEVGSEEDALIRLGVAGTYLGETLCRQKGWSWFFKPDTRLKQFSYLASVVRKDGKELDPYQWAFDLFAGHRGVADLEASL